MVTFAAGRLPVIAGTGSNSTSQTIDLSLEVGDAGMDAYLIVVPYYACSPLRSVGDSPVVPATTRPLVPCRT